MIVTTILHVHERRGSEDSQTSADAMIGAYRRLFDSPVAVGFVGHDTIVRTHHPDVITFTGVEYELRKEPTRLHIVKYPDHDFSVLAHPSETWPDDTRENTVRAIERYGVDAVERWNSGNVEYQGSVPAVEVAGDDAHSTVGAAASYMKVDVDEYDPDAIMSKLKSGKFEAVNDPAYRRDVFHQMEKSTSLLWERFM